MKYRRLGGTELDVSPICVGAMHAAGRKGTDDERTRQGKAALRAALDDGVNCIHSSFEYSARWMIGEVLKDHSKRTEVNHIIKVPVPDRPDGDRFDPKRFRELIETALTELRAERIAVLQWITRFGPHTDENRLVMLDRVLDDLRDTFSTLRDEGKVGYLFTFPYTLPYARRAIETEAFSGLVGYYNLIETEMMEVFDEVVDHDMGFIVIRPFLAGTLTDKYSSPDVAPPGHRLRDPARAEHFARRAKILRELPEAVGDSLTGFALRFTLAHPAVGTVITGMNTPQQVRQLLEAVEDDKELPGAELVAEIRRISLQDAHAR